MSNPELLKPVEVMSILRVSRSKLFKLMQTSTFPSIRIGRTLLVEKDSLLSWINNQKNRKFQNSERNQEVAV